MKDDTARRRCSKLERRMVRIEQLAVQLGQLLEADRHRMPSTVRQAAQRVMNLAAEIGG